MTLRHLEIFAAVADHGTMSGAARALYIAQPTVSQAVAELESADVYKRQAIPFPRGSGRWAALTSS